jgi:excisionase family DNA binding protein
LTSEANADIVVVNNIMNDYVTVNEAARRLGRSIEQVRRYLREGRLPGRRIGLQWFIEEEALARWRPERRATGRVGEAVATYEAKTMKTDETKEPKPLIDPQLLNQIFETAQRIHKQTGDIDVVELLRQDREEH